MTDGLRERKKARTRQALFDAAMRLFTEQGYEQTTVAEIAAAADVSTKTLFNYFPSKDDMVFALRTQRMNLVTRVIEERGQHDRPADLLASIGERLLASALTGADGQELPFTPVPVRLVMTVPELQAKALLLLFDAQRQWSQALTRAYPDELDPLAAAAAVGALIGTLQMTALVSFERGDSPEEIVANMRSAMDIALHGVRHLDHGAPAHR
ncbi:TetR/AcrR family transcriptional regulator [Actinophytocola sediminis]